MLTSEMNMRYTICCLLLRRVIRSGRPTDPSVGAWEILNKGVAEQYAPKRAQAYSAVGTIRTPDAEKLLNNALTDKDYSVRLTAVSVLAERKSRAEIPRLKKALNDESAEVSFTAAKALWEMGDHSGKDVLQQVLSGDRKGPGFVQSEVRSVKATARDRKVLIWMGAREGAGFLFGPLGAGIGLAESATKDGQAPVRALSAMLLGQELNDPNSIAYLGSALYDKNPLVRTASAKALGGFTDPTVLPKLQYALADKSDPVRFMAAASIVRFVTNTAKGKK